MKSLHDRLLVDVTLLHEGSSYRAAKGRKEQGAAWLVCLAWFVRACGDRGERNAKGIVRENTRAGVAMRSTCCGSVEICDARFDVLYFQFGQAGHGVQAVSRLVPCGGPGAGAGRCGPGGGRAWTLSGLGVGACEKDSGAACRALHVEHHRAGRTRKRPGRCAPHGSFGPEGPGWDEGGRNCQREHSGQRDD